MENPLNEYRYMIESKLKAQKEESTFATFLNLHSSLVWGDLIHRNTNFDLGILQLGYEMLKQCEETTREERSIIWQWFQDYVIVENVDNPEEREPIIKFIELNYIELAAEEVQKPDCNFINTILNCISWVAQEEASIPKIIELKVLHSLAIESIIRREQVFSDQAIALIRALSAPEGKTREILRNDGALDAILPFLISLLSENDVEIRRGFRAASIVARLAGDDEKGIGPHIFRGYPNIISCLVGMLDRVLDAGPRGTVINMAIDPHLITMDLLVIATSDANKPLLQSIVKTLVKALTLRGRGNKNMVHDILFILLQLCHDQECFKEITSISSEIVDLIETLIKSPQSDLETCRAKDLLIANITKDSNNCHGVHEKLKNPLDSQVVISYYWQEKPLAVRLEKVLRERGEKTWIDFRNMQGPKSSILKAIENCSSVVVFLSKKYKESSCCRRELEYAIELNKPICYILAEEEFEPCGWIEGHVKKKKKYAGWSIEEIEKSSKRILEQVTSARKEIVTSFVVDNNSEEMKLLMSKLSLIEEQMNALKGTIAEVCRDKKRNFNRDGF